MTLTQQERTVILLGAGLNHEQVAAILDVSLEDVHATLTGGEAGDSGWVALTPMGTYSAYTGSDIAAPAIRREGNVARVRGSFDGGSGGPVFQVPEGFEPPDRQEQPVNTQVGVVAAAFTPDGLVTPLHGAVTAITFSDTTYRLA